MIKIAFVGCFDVENYGDHLFPIIFKKAMDDRHIDVELTLFSPLEKPQGFNQDKYVYAIKDIENIHKEKTFDCVVVGGGEIIHLNAYKERLFEDSKDFEVYSIYDNWVIPSVFCKKNKIPLIWNNPGIPYFFNDHYKYIARFLVSQVDYISIRNIFSKDVLLDLGFSEEEVNLSVDTAFYLPNIYNKDFLNNLDIYKASCTDKYIVFHCHRFIGDEYLEECLSVLKKLFDKGYKIILLPLAYTHGDDDFALELNRRVGYKYITFNKKLKIEEIVAILSNCELYIGVSFHGAVTSFCYNRKIIGYDFFRYKKTKDLYYLMGVPENYIDSVGELQGIVEKVLSEKEIGYKSSEIILKDLNYHFDQIAKKITNINNEKRSDAFNYSFYSDFITSLSLNEQEKCTIIDNLNEFIKNNQETVNNLNKTIEINTKKITDLKGESNYNLLNWQNCSKMLEEKVKENIEVSSQVTYYKAYIDEILSQLQVNENKIKQLESENIFDFIKRKLRK